MNGIPDQEAVDALHLLVQGPLALPAHVIILCTALPYVSNAVETAFAGMDVVLVQMHPVHLYLFHGLHALHGGAKQLGREALASPTSQKSQYPSHSAPLDFGFSLTRCYHRK